MAKGIQVALQRIQVGFRHADQTVAIELGDTTVRVIDQHGKLLATTPSATTARSAGSRPRCQGVNSFQCPSETTSTVPSVTLMAV
jgi:hypothetical protein